MSNKFCAPITLELVVGDRTLVVYPKDPFELSEVIGAALMLYAPAGKDERSAVPSNFTVCNELFIGRSVRIS